MPIKTTSQTFLSVTEAEVSRVNTALTAGEQAAAAQVKLQADNAKLTKDLADAQNVIRQQAASIQQLLDQLGQLPPVEPPPPPPPPVPPVGQRDRVYVEGNRLKRRDGTLVKSGIESMYAGQGTAAHAAAFVSTHKALGADIISPLPNGRWLTGATDINTHKRLLDASKAAGLVHGYNVDHMRMEGAGIPGREWLRRPDVVALLNSYDNVFIECEVETGWDQTASAWRDDVNQMVRELREAGHKSVIKVGSPAGGRRPVEAIAAGRSVLEADPLKQVIFTWQCYWPEETRDGWTYQSDNGVASGVAGTLQMCDQIKNSGLCFLVGLESYDPSGAENGTGFQQIAARLKQHGIIWQWWVLSNGSDPTALVRDAVRPETITAMGQTVKQLLLNS